MSGDRPQGQPSEAEIFDRWCRDDGSFDGPSLPHFGRDETQQHHPTPLEEQRRSCDEQVQRHPLHLEQFDLQSHHASLHGQPRHYDSHPFSTFHHPPMAAQATHTTSSSHPTNHCSREPQQPDSNFARSQHCHPVHHQRTHLPDSPPPPSPIFEVVAAKHACSPQEKSHRDYPSLSEDKHSKTVAGASSAAFQAKGSTSTHSSTSSSLSSSSSTSSSSPSVSSTLPVHLAHNQHAENYHGAESGSTRPPRGAGAFGGSAQRERERSPSPPPLDDDVRKRHRSQASSPTRLRDLRVHRSAVEKCDEGFGKSMREVTMKLMAHYGLHAKHSRSLQEFMQTLTRHFYQKNDTTKCTCDGCTWTACLHAGFTGENCTFCPVCRFGQFVLREGLINLPYANLCPCVECMKTIAMSGRTQQESLTFLKEQFRKRRFHKFDVCNCKKLDPQKDKCILELACEKLVEAHRVFAAQNLVWK